MTHRFHRARDLGLEFGSFLTGENNAITDVPGVRVGQTTLIEGTDIRTGVTAIVPPSLPVSAEMFVGNGYGKLIGTTQLEELGEIETPILLTGTLSAFRVTDALVGYMLSRPEHRNLISINPIVGETNDGYLSDIRLRPVSETHVLKALTAASGGRVDEGCVGAGTGTTALGFKAGIGTSSRVLGACTIGVLVQANFGGVLTIRGKTIPAPPSNDIERGNSCMIVVVTDAPMDARQLRRVATRAVFAMGRVGASFSHGSGDYGIAISTATDLRMAEHELDPWFAAVQDATEEAIVNSLVAATTTFGYRSRVRFAIDHDEIRSAIERAQGSTRDML